MTISEFLEGIPRFDSLPGTDQVLAIGWYLHTQRGEEAFTNAQLRNAFREAHREGPDVSVYLPRMAARKPPPLLKTRAGYRLSGTVRRQLDSKYGQHPTSAAVSKLLASIPDRLPNSVERSFLAEAINCYRVHAFRAAIIMSWNLAFDHLLDWLISDANRLAEFNTAFQSKYPRKAFAVSNRDDFEELKEFEVVEICRTGRLFSKNIVDILREKLTKRNMAAHPSAVVVTQHQADDVITDLMNNVVLALT